MDEKNASAARRRSALWAAYNDAAAQYEGHIRPDPDHLATTDAARSLAAIVDARWQAYHAWGAAAAADADLAAEGR